MGFRTRARIYFGFPVSEEDRLADRPPPRWLRVTVRLVSIGVTIAIGFWDLQLAVLLVLGFCVNFGSRVWQRWRKDRGPYL